MNGGEGQGLRCDGFERRRVKKRLRRARGKVGGGLGIQCEM